MKNSLLYVIGLLVAVAILMLGYFYWDKNNGEPVEDNTFDILSFNVEDNQFVVRAYAANRIVVSAMPTGTGLSEADRIPLGEMIRSGSEAEPAVWTLSIPEEEMSLTEISAVGYSEDGESERVSLPVTGATDISELLWKNNETNNGGESSVNETWVAKIGEQKNVGGITIIVSRLIEDSRCPKDVQCIQAGQARAEVVIVDGSERKTLVLKEKETITASAGRLTLQKVEPYPISTVSRDEGDFRFTLSFSR